MCKFEGARLRQARLPFERFEPSSTGRLERIQQEPVRSCASRYVPEQVHLDIYILPRRFTGSKQQKGLRPGYQV